MKCATLPLPDSVLDHPVIVSHTLLLCLSRFHIFYTSHLYAIINGIMHEHFSTAIDGT